MSARRTHSADDSLPATTNGKPKASARALAHIIERSSRIQGPAATAYVDRLRRANPEAAPSVITTKLEKRYLGAVTASGAAVGSAALLPGIGTLAALSAAAGETAVFLEATAFFALAIAAVHGVPAENRELRRALVLAVLVGDDSKHAIAELLGPGREERCVAVGGGGIAADARVGAVEFAVAQARRQAIHAATQCAAVRQDAADRNRRHHRRDR